MKSTFLRIAFSLCAVVAIGAAAIFLSTPAVSDPCEVNGPCVRACEAQRVSCVAGCLLPNGTYDLTCVGNCASAAAACAEGCVVCP